MNTRYEAAQALRALIDARRQATRLLRLSFPKDDGPANALFVANRLEADEGLSRDFVFTVEVLSDSPTIALEDLIGKLVTLSLTRVDGTIRYFSGHVFEFRFIRNDAGFSFYDMVLRPWLAFLRYRHDNYLFHGKTVEQQTDEVFRDYAMRDWQTLSLGTDEPMTDACQWDESDYNYLHRRWEARGWHYRYEHRQDGHTLMLGGESWASPPIDGDGEIQWQGTSGIREIGIAEWSRVRTLASTHYTARSFDFKIPSPRTADQPTLNKQGVLPHLEVYDYAGAYGFERGVKGEDLTRRRIEAIEAAALHFEGRGDDDHVQSGRRFMLDDPRDLSRIAKSPDDRDFLILEARHSVSNNFELREGGVAEYANTLRCIRRKTKWRPPRGFNSTEPRLYGLQTAIVVGPRGETIHTDAYGRVRVQFHWDREGARDERSSAWVRVASQWAGSEFGQLALPRIGQEVVVQWLDGNPDRPLITGRVHNRKNMPPEFSHQGSLPANRALSGWSTREIGAEREQQLRFDDTTGQISTQLASDHGHSQLNLGCLTHPRSEGRAEPRGDGFELRSDDSGSIRSAKTLLISAWKRLDAQSHQLSAEEHVGLMQDCLDLFKSLGRYAAEHQAGPVDAAPQSALRDEVRSAMGEGKEKTATLNLTAPDGMALSTPKSWVSYAGVNIDAVAQKNYQQTAGGHYIVNAGSGASIFSHQGGISATAHHGKLLLQSQHDDTRIDSAKDVKLSAAGGKLVGMAQDEITFVTAGGAYLKLSGGSVEIGGPEALTVKTAGHHWGGAASLSTDLPRFGEGDLGRTPRLIRPTDGQPVEGVKLHIEQEEAGAVSGETDAGGRGTKLVSDKLQRFTSYFYLPRS